MLRSVKSRKTYPKGRDMVSNVGFKIPQGLAAGVGEQREMPLWVSAHHAFTFSCHAAPSPALSASLLLSPRPDPMEGLQMVKQEELGRRGREGRPRHGARGSPSSAEGWQKSCSRQRGRDSCCGGGGLRRERNSLETALFYTLVFHRSCPWNLFVGGRNHCGEGDPLLRGAARRSHCHPCPCTAPGYGSARLWPRAAPRSVDEPVSLIL